MSGHSKWHNIKHKKMAEDVKRGKIFSKLTREIMIAVKQGGTNPDTNPRLRSAIESAKDANMPRDNIEKAIKKASGELGTEQLEEVFFEGYAPGGVAMFVEAITDNKNRVSSTVRSIFSKFKGRLAEAGSVSWLFDRKSLFVFSRGEVDENKLYEAALEAGAEDIKEDEDFFEVYADTKDFEKLRKIFLESELKWDRAEVTMIPKNSIRVTGGTATQVLKLLETLEEQDEVQKVWANFDIPDDELKRIMIE